MDFWGRLTLDAFKHDMIVWSAGIGMILGGATAFGLLLYFGKLKWLWTNWITTLDHKKIGIMYIIVSLVMLGRAVVESGMLKAQQAIAHGDSAGFLTADHFQQVFTAHGTLMIFFVAMGLMFGLINVILPLQLGARDVAFPFLNSVSFWLYFMGAMLMNVSLIVGEFSAVGWLAYSPLSELGFSPGSGVDYWIWALQISGIGTTLSGINFLVTIIKMRAPGMTLKKMPIFSWSVLGSMMMVLAAFPVLTATLTMLSLDRVLGMHFFTSELGGNPMLYVNLIWAWGHPEVYILILPAFGIFSEVVATFARKRLFGYMTMVWALMIITLLSMIVWLHHFFTMGAGANVNAFFGIMTMIIAIPTGVKMFNWLATLHRGRIKLASPMIWFIGFILSFTIGGVTGVMLAVPALNFQVHNSLFLVAHFHNQVIGGVIFGYFAGLYYWFPKIFGFKLSEKLGKMSAWLWLVGFFVTFVPIYILGFMGVTRRLNQFDVNPGWQALFIVSAIGGMIIITALATQMLQLLLGLRDRKKNLDKSGDPWNGRTLEWATTSPAPHYNFAVVPKVDKRDQFWYDKQEKVKKSTKYQDIELPKNSPFGFIIGSLAFAFGFGIVWHMWWLAILGVIGVIVCLVVRSMDEEPEYVVAAKEIAKIESGRKEYA